jgi:hypothetical protein
VGSGLEETRGVFFSGVHSQNHNARFQPFANDLFGRLDAIQAGHRQVHDDNVWSRLADQAKRFLSIARFPNDRNISAILKQPSQTLPYDGVIIG